MSCPPIWVEDLLPYILMNVASYVFRYHYVTCRQTQVPVGTRRYQQAHVGRIIGRWLLPILADESEYRGRTSVFEVVVAASHVTQADSMVACRGCMLVAEDGCMFWLPTPSIGDPAGCGIYILKCVNKNGCPKESKWSVVLSSRDAQSGAR